MTLYTDENCGIKEPHRHTGEIVHGHHIQYWCPTLTAWIDNNESYGNPCTCTLSHVRARTQTIVTETIYILPVTNVVQEVMWEEMAKRL